MAEKTTIKIQFTDFWKGFNPRDNNFHNLLIKHYNVELSDTPDFLFYSVFGCSYLDYPCTRIFFTGENVRPDFSQCDYSLSFDHDDYHGKNYRFPVYAIEHDLQLLLRPKDPESIMRDKKKFCNFVYSNPDSQRRIEFFRKLCRYRQVDSGGMVLNNIGGRIKDKIKFIADYTFTIAFENESYPGYTTEKIVDAMQVNSIPIYWGNPKIDLDFNAASFINCHDFADDEAILRRVREIDQNDDSYRQLLAEPWLKGSVLNRYVDEANVLAWFGKIFHQQSTYIPVAQRNPNPLRDSSIKASFAARAVRNRLARLSKRILGMPIRDE